MSQARLAFAAPRRLAGVDEAGRGPLAGPVVAAAVILDPRRPIRGLADSKVLLPAVRERLSERIRTRALAWSIAWADREEIDALNILQATLLAMRRALLGLRLAPRRDPGRRQSLPIARRPGPALRHAPRGQGRRPGARDQRGIDSRQDLPRRPDAHAPRALSAIRLRRSQGVLHARSPHRARHARRMPSASALVLACVVQQLWPWLTDERLATIPSRTSTRQTSSCVWTSRHDLRSPATAYRVFAVRRHRARAAADGSDRGRRHAGGRAHRRMQPVRDGEVLSRGAGAWHQAASSASTCACAKRANASRPPGSRSCAATWRVTAI